MKTFRLRNKVDKKIFWGGLDSNNIINGLKELIDKIEIVNENKINIELDLEGVNSIDPSFIKNVFIDIKQNLSHKPDVNFIFKNIENEMILYNLDALFEYYHISATANNMYGEEITIGAKKDNAVNV
ncbi:MAG: hypothetical protein K9I68_00275 [Bacteroidales bacterium]|nr:hypothetical protein [Bacteroidales bacterium]MCF8336414.1 hypothetical protein [Bacteroidales bacterium]